jgi:hypothetical protein
METKAKRTLVKSAPELWELADDLARMEAWMGGLMGSGQPIAVEITDRDPERIIAWRAARTPMPAASEGGAAHARIAIELASSGWGTAVSVTAQHSAPEPQAAIAALEQLLDELGSAGRRPFPPQ